MTHRKWIFGAVAVVSFLAFCKGAAATTLYVDGSVPSSGDGTSWQNACKTIQKGIDAAAAGDTIIVAPGTYIETIQFGGKKLILTSTKPLDPDVVADTIIDGNQAGSVVTFSGTETTACLLTGFTIRNGSAQFGGGIRGNDTLAAIRQNIITGNSAGDGGGVHGCKGVIENNSVTENLAASAGGGLCYCSGIIRNNVITGNRAEEGWPLGGGGLYGCDGRIENNTIAHNSAGLGGGLAFCNGTVQSNLIFGNSSDSNGGAFARCDGMILNNTIYENSAALDGGGLYSCKGTTANCILWGNTATGSGNETYDSTTPSFCCITDWTGGGTGNIKDPPQFADTNAHDFHLLAGSPCIDAGDDSILAAPAADMDGNLRIALGERLLTVDIGAYEFNSVAFVVTAIGLDEKGDVRITWNSQPNDTYTVWTRTVPSVGLWVKEKTVSIPSQGTSSSWTFPLPLESKKFYRIRTK